MKSKDFFTSEFVSVNQFLSHSTECLCGSDDDCGCEGGEGSCECGYDPECE